MKIKVFFLIALFVTTVFAVNAQDKNIQGTWKLIDERAAEAGDTNIKIINSTHFMWVWYHSDGKPFRAGSGTQTAKDGKYTETITVNAMPLLIGAQAICTYEIVEDGKKMISRGYIEKEGVKLIEINEVYEKVEVLETNAPEVQDTWKLIDVLRAAAGITHIKVINSNHFMFVTYTSDGKPTNVGYGTQTTKDGKYIETIVGNAMSMLVGAQAIYDYKVVGKDMTISGRIEKEGVKLMEFNEAYEKFE